MMGATRKRRESLGQWHAATTAIKQTRCQVRKLSLDRALNQEKSKLLQLGELYWCAIAPTWFELC